MIFNCRLQILRAKPINALIAFPPRLSGVGGETQCIVGFSFFNFLIFLCPGVPSDCRLPFPEAPPLRGRRSGAAQIQTVAPSLHFHIPNRLIVSTLSFIPHTCVRLASYTLKSFKREEGGVASREKKKKKKTGIGVLGGFSFFSSLTLRHAAGTENKGSEWEKGTSAGEINKKKP